ncbi:LLM class flavin-dependent oxidoreductase, partial [Listeria monocytogenes]|nr:LLM class flavin-dependent oxidoreductase [Listeria monocytogenes]
ILDQSILNPGEQPSESLRNTVELAQLAEKLGYHRFCVAEHHNSDEIAGAAPEVLLVYIAAITSTIKLASGGIMLQHY